MKFTAEQIAQYIGGRVEGDIKAEVDSFAKIEKGKKGAISFLSDLHYEHYLYESESTVVLVDASFTPSQPVSATLIYVENVRGAVGKLLALYQQAMSQPRVGIHPSAVVEPSATIGKDVYIGPHVYVGEDVVIGDNTQLYANTVIEERSKVGKNCLFYAHVSVYHDCVIGDDVILHSGCCIGADGFGFAPTAEGYDKIPQIGNVIIEDGVEIGANACVDRAVMDATIIHKGVKLDNLVQIAHNCEIGAHTVMSAQVGVAGTTKIGEWCVFGGQVGVAGHTQIASQTQCGAQSGISGSIKKTGQTIMGSPAIDARRFARASAVFRNLDRINSDVNQMQKELKLLKEQKQ